MADMKIRGGDAGDISPQYQSPSAKAKAAKS